MLRILFKNQGCYITLMIPDWSSIDDCLWSISRPSSSTSKYCVFKHWKGSCKFNYLYCIRTITELKELQRNQYCTVESVGVQIDWGHKACSEPQHVHRDTVTINKSESETERYWRKSKVHKGHVLHVVQLAEIKPSISGGKTASLTKNYWSFDLCFWLLLYSPPPTTSLLS